MFRQTRSKAKLLFLNSSQNVSLFENTQEEHEVVSDQFNNDWLDKVVKVDPDLILFHIEDDVNTVISACQKVRGEQKMRHIPIFVVSHQNDLEKKIAAYRAGVDDYIVKPIEQQELMAKISARVRRGVDQTTKSITLANMTLNLQRMEVTIENRTQTLGKLEMHLLALFMRNPGFVLSRHDILNQVWKNVSVTERTIDAHIVSLRRKIKGFHGHLGTVYGSGYVLRMGSFQSLKVPQVAV